MVILFPPSFPFQLLSLSLFLSLSLCLCCYHYLFLSCLSFLYLSFRFSIYLMDNIKIEHCSNIKVTKKKDNHKYLCLLFSSPPLKLSFAVRLPSHIQHMSKMRIAPSLSILLICLLFLCLDIPPSSSLLPPPPFLCLCVVWNTERESSLSRSFCLACSNSN